jgi:tetratricopeptide (TPR) repeat protein
MNRAMSLQAELRESFQTRLERVYRELERAIRLQRPAILLLIYASEWVRDEVERALTQRLGELGQRIVRLRVDEDHADVPALLAEAPNPQQAVFFVAGLQWGGGADGLNAYRALNLRREHFIEPGWRAVFWLTEGEAVALAQHAPDFWAFRHRVIEFVEPRETLHRADLAREIAWHDWEFRTLWEDTEAKIRLREALLEELPAGDETLAARADLLYTLGWLYWAVQDNSKAIETFQDALQVAQKLDDTHFVAGSYNGLGNVYRTLGRHQEAIDAYQQAIDLDPDYASPWNGLGSVYHDMSRHEEALDAYQKAIDLDPSFAASWNNLGNVYRTLGRHQEAIDACQQAIDLDPDYASPWHGLGNVYADLGRHQEALDAYQQAIDLDPSFAYPWYGLGNVYRTLGRDQEALDAFRKATDLNPNVSSLWHGLGIEYTMQGQYEQALEAFSKAVELAPERGMLRSSLVGIQRRLGREAEAAEQEKIAGPLTDKEDEYNRACFEAICGNTDEALRLLQIALEKRQTSPEWARQDPDFDHIRHDPRFQELVG